ncbi:DUF86 domain-containing protein [Oscillatoria sp. CS-180]|uniref:HepT-like ribonuclease domain-containing protein n=1 Tax=Oscillatoria sp. CS-180 TaxID=3021720 RepID=UPI0023303604|nr:DUF86 domain-containing protein [Oscillatoria sp. CS-180]MDB9527031.1 DUF86 domain-containing protein [Oscillatoria sp. CS-180]
MYERSLLPELFLETEEAIRRIERRFSDINSPADFLANNAGLDRSDAIAMMLIAIGENIQRITKRIDPGFFTEHPEINWEGIKSIRNLLAHDYFNIDAEEIYHICDHEIGLLKQAIQQIRSALF